MKQPNRIDERDALILHDRLLALHGGAPGVRDGGLLASAVARPRQHLGYVETADIIHLAAIYTDGIVRNHPSVDGTRRTGFVAGILFLEINDYYFTASEEDAAIAVLALAAGEIEVDEYAAFPRANVTRQDAEN